MWLEFKLAYYDDTVQHVSHYAMNTLPIAEVHLTPAHAVGNELRDNDDTTIVITLYGLNIYSRKTLRLIF